MVAEKPLELCKVYHFFFFVLNFEGIRKEDEKREEEKKKKKWKEEEKESDGEENVSSKSSPFQE